MFEEDWVSTIKMLEQVMPSIYDDELKSNLPHEEFMANLSVDWGYELTSFYDKWYEDGNYET